MTFPAPTDPEGFFVDGPTGPIHVTDEGARDAPAVVMIHGIPGSVRDFRYLAPAVVAAGLRAVRIDCAGFGKTPRESFPATTMEARAAFVRNVARSVGCARFAIAAHSFGGGAATFCAALFPDDVTALALINSLGTRRHRGLVIPPRVVRALHAVAGVPVVGAKVLASQRRGYERAGLRSDIPLTDELLRHHMALIAAVDFAQVCAAARQVRAPVLVASADDDPIVEPRVARHLLDRLENAPMLSHLHTEKGGHFLQKHEADAIALWLALVLRADGSADGQR